MSKPIDLSKVSTEDLKKALAEKNQSEKAAAEKKRKEYERDKEELINWMGKKAGEVSAALTEFKKTGFEKLESFRAVMLDYGAIRKGERNKGNFEIKNEDFKIIFSSQVKHAFDERSLMAEKKLKNWLEGFVKNRDKKLHKFIMGLMERNHKTGDLDIKNINRIYKMENDFEDQDWKDAIKLFKESYNPVGTTLYVRTYKRNERNGWDLIDLNYSSI